MVDLQKPYVEQFDRINHIIDMGREAQHDRDQLIRFLRHDRGLHLDVIADMAGMTKQRVHQITQP